MTRPFPPALGAALLLAACAQTPQPAEPEPATLDGQWRLETVDGRSLTPRERGATPTLSFVEPDGFSGRAGCNGYNGGYVADTFGAFSVERFAITALACPFLDFESLYTTALRAADGYALAPDGSSLSLLDGGTPILTYVPLSR